MASAQSRIAPLDILDRRGICEVDPIESGTSVEEVEMRVVESRQDGGALRIDGRGLRPLQPQDLAIASDTEDLIAANRDSFSHRALVGGRIDSSVVDDEVHRAVAVVSLGADDQPGDQRDRNDGDNDECGETGRHFDLRNRRVDAPQTGCAF